MTFTDTPFSEAKRSLPTPSLRNHLRAEGRLRTLLHLLGLGLLVFIVYFGMWRAYFASLDDFWITGWVRHRASLWDAIQGYGSGVRFLNYVPIWFKSQAFGVDAAPYLWISLLQFSALVFAVYALVRQVAKLHPQARALALLTSLCFAVAYNHYEVVTYVSASDYTFWATLYVVCVTLFVRYLWSGQRWVYAIAWFLYALLAFGHDFTLNLPLVLLAAHLTVGWRRGSLGRARLRDLLPHLPFWGLWAIHVSIQLYLVVTGTSEAVYSDNGYAPGLHMLSNLRYLIFLLLPNITLDPIYNFLSRYVSTAVLNESWQLLMGLGILLQMLFVLLAVKGNRLVRFAVALIYLPFLQYTPWQGHFIEAPRYLLLPSIGFALLLGIGLNALFERVGHLRWWRRSVFAAVILFVFANVGVIQFWVQQHIVNGELRRTFVTQLEQQYHAQITPTTEVWIEVPAAKYTDLEAACRLVFPYYVPCHAFIGLGDNNPPPWPVQTTTTRFWLKVTPLGIVQRLPAE